MVFYNNYVDLCNKKGMSPSAAAEAMGFKRSVVTRWANGTQPRQATLQKIASFFGCTVEELTKEKAPSDSGERVTDKQLKFALFDGAEDISDAQLDEVKAFAKWVKQRDEKKG